MPSNSLKFLIDKITNSIESSTTGEGFVTKVELVLADEIKHVHKKDGWLFNWKTEFKESERQLYKLTLIDSPVIQGLISLQPVPDQEFVEMHLLESAPHNYGAHKEFLGVAGNLVAFACKSSIDLGYEGFVAFTAKTRLVDHYVETLGAQLIYGQERMAIFPDSARKLVTSYFKEYRNDR